MLISPNIHTFVNKNTNWTTDKNEIWLQSSVKDREYQGVEWSTHYGGTNLWFNPDLDDCNRALRNKG